MNGRRIFYWLALLLLVLVLRPSGVWREGKELWRRRDYVLRVLVTAITIYLLYGVYQMYQQGMLSW